MKKKYFLFLLGNFDDIQTVELLKEKIVSLKFKIIDEDYMSSAIVFIIETDISNKPLNHLEDIEKIKEISEVVNYYLFPTSSLISSFMPDTFKGLVQTSFIQKFFETMDMGFDVNQIMYIKIDNTEKTNKYNLESLLDKINESGIDSLTDDELNFLKKSSSEI
jgi:hypothetical protein